MNKNGGIKNKYFARIWRNKKYIGTTRYNAISNYLNEVNKNQDSKLFLSDILYKEKEYKKFENWFNKKIYPFIITNFKNEKFSVSLDQKDFCYDWISDIKSDKYYYGDGHCYNDAFYEYLEKSSNSLNNKLNYDSENGMFCVYTSDIKIADEVAFVLANLYKDENKMIELIKKTKEKYGYMYDVHL